MVLGRVAAVVGPRAALSATTRAVVERPSAAWVRVSEKAAAGPTKCGAARRTVSGASFTGQRSQHDLRQTHSPSRRRGGDTAHRAGRGLRRWQRRQQRHRGDAAAEDDDRTVGGGPGGEYPSREVLVDSQGRTLYLFTKDSQNQSACSGMCATFWPPLQTGGKPTAGPGAMASLVGTIKRSDGTSQVMYNGRQQSPPLREGHEAGDVQRRGRDGVRLVGLVRLIAAEPGTEVGPRPSDRQRQPRPLPRRRPPARPGNPRPAPKASPPPSTTASPRTAVAMATPTTTAARTTGMWRLSR